jgi:probable HAF family extracellular repeat protein
MSTLKLFLTLAFALCALTLSTRADDKTLLIELPPGTLPRDISANGMVVGELTSGGGFYWLPTTGVVYIGGQMATAVSRGGDTIAGIAYSSGNVTQAAIWQRAAEWRLLGSVVPNAVPCDALLSSSYDASDDGQVIVGLAWNGCNFARAFRWEESTGMVDLGTMAAGSSTRANGVSGDGRVVVGWQEQGGPRRGARWVDGKQELFTGPSGFIGEARSANRDGSIVVGQSCEFASTTNLFGNQQAWIWSARDGIKCLQPPRIRVAANFIGIAQAASEDGYVIGGSQSFGLEAESVIWIDHEPMYLRDYLRENGIPGAFEGWVNTGFINAVSRDGRMLVGQGAGRRDFQGFIVILPNGGRS